MTSRYTSLPCRDNLCATTPRRNQGCNKHSCTQLVDGETHFTVPGPSSSSTRRSPATTHTCARGWQSYTPTEGRRYYTRGIGPRIISEVDLLDGAISAAVDAWADLILEWAAELDLELSSSTELFIEPGVDTKLCDYYLVDHRDRSMFWLGNEVASVLSLPNVCSQQHLELVLEENYWKHIELYSSHLDDLPGALEELIAIYLHGRTDLALSPSSTFLFSPDVTDIHLRTLLQSRSLPNDITIPFMSKLWGHVVSARLANLDSDSDCASRDIHVYQRQSTSVFFRLASYTMFGIPAAIRSQLEEHIFGDDMVEAAWMTYIAGNTAKWQMIVQGCLGIMNIAMAIPGSPPIPLLTHMCLLLGLIGLLVSVLLQNYFDGLDKNSANARAFLESHSNKMALLSVILGFPRAVFIWSVVLFNVQAVYVFFSVVPLFVSIPFCAPLIILAWSMWYILGPFKHFSFRVPTVVLLEIPLHVYPRRQESDHDQPPEGEHV